MLATPTLRTVRRVYLAWLIAACMFLGPVLVAEALKDGTVARLTIAILIAVGMHVLGLVLAPVADYSFIAPAQFFLLMMYGGPTAAVATSIAMLCVRLVLPWRRTLLAAAETVITGWFIAICFSALGGQAGRVSLPGDYLPIIAAMAVAAISNYLISGANLTLFVDTPRNVLASWIEDIRGMPAAVMHEMLETSAGAIAGITFLRVPWGVPFLVPAQIMIMITRGRAAQIQRVTERALEAFATIIDERDPYTAQHSERVTENSLKIAEQLGFAPLQLRRLYWSSRLHDLGKVSIDNAILNKPGKLTDDEFEVIRMHPEVSARILASFDFDAHDVEVVRSHHERFDGRGYLKRDAHDVPFEAHIIAVADTFDAMTSDRPYRKGLPVEVALQEIHDNIGTQFEPRAARAFLEVMGFYDAATHKLAGELHNLHHGELGSAGADRATRNAMPALPIDDVGRLVVDDDAGDNEQLPEAA